MSEFRPCIHPWCEFHLGCRSAVEVRPEYYKEKVTPANGHQKVIIKHNRIMAFVHSIKLYMLAFHEQKILQLKRQMLVLSLKCICMCLYQQKTTSKVNHVKCGSTHGIESMNNNYIIYIYICTTNFVIVGLHAYLMVGVSQHLVRHYLYTNFFFLRPTKYRRKWDVHHKVSV